MEDRKGLFARPYTKDSQTVPTNSVENRNDSETVTKQYDKTAELIEKIDNYKAELDHNKKEIEKVNFIMAGVVIFIVVTFSIEILTTRNDYLENDRLYLKYSDLHDKYLNESQGLKEDLIKISNENKDLKHQFEILKIKNYLK